MVTTTLTVPAACADVRTLIEVALIERTVATAPPNVTVAPDAKLLPAMETKVPPFLEPLVGEIDLIVGAGAV